MEELARPLRAELEEPSLLDELLLFRFRLRLLESRFLLLPFEDEALLEELRFRLLLLDLLEELRLFPRERDRNAVSAGCPLAFPLPPISISRIALDPAWGDRLRLGGGAGGGMLAPRTGGGATQAAPTIVLAAGMAFGALHL